MKTWSEQELSGSHPFMESWNKWGNTIDENSPFYSIRKATNVTDLHQYLDLLKQCPAITDNMYLHWDIAQQCVQWRMRPPPRLNPYKRSSLPDIGDYKAAEPVYLQQPSQLTDTSSSTMIGTVHRLVDPPDHIDPSEAPSENDQNQEINNTREAETYLRQSVIPPLTDDNIASLRIDIESEPVEGPASTQINRFLHFFQDTYNSQMGKLGTYVHNVKTEIAAAIANTNARLNEYQEQLDKFHEVFDTTIHEAHTKMSELDSRVQHNHWNWQQRASEASTRVAQVCSHYEQIIKGVAVDAHKQFKDEIQADLDAAIQAAVSEHLELLMAENMRSIKQHSEEALLNLESTYAEMVADITDTTFATHGHRVELAPQPNIHAPATTTWRSHTINTEPLKASEYPQAATSYKGPPVHSQTGRQEIQRDRWGLRLPGYEHVSHSTSDENQLAQLNHRDFISKVKVRYSEGKMFTFYNKLRNVGVQYGVYLLPADQIQYDRSLCPNEYDGVVITDARYYKMAATLYEKLSDSECIPERCQQPRNVVDRYVDANDGYQVLYELMEDYHPAMKRDPIISAPKSIDCGEDIQEYSAQFQTFITIEKLNGRSYKERELVLHFLRGLSEDFNPAVQYVNTLMDAWGQTGLNPKCDLRVLPRTIADYLNANGNGPAPITNAIIRVAHGAPQDNSTKEERSQLDAITQLLQQQVEKSEAIIRAYRGSSKAPAAQSKHLSMPADAGKETRRFTDVYCKACRGYGHPKTKCDFAARMIKSLDFIAALDATKRKEILDEFLTEQRRKRDNKQTSLAGKARVCRDANDVEGLYKLLIQGDPGTDSEREIE